MSQHIFWIMSRAAGTTALLLSSLGVCLGLLMGGRVVKVRRLELRVLHEALSLGTLVALGVHAFSLLGDAYLKPSLADILIPFASGYQEPWMAIGIIGGWLMLLLGLSFYVRDRIGPARWRTLHRFTALAWIAGVAHSLGEGTDAGQAWFLIATGLVVIPAAALLIVRLFGGRLSARRPARGPVVVAPITPSRTTGRA
jgi:sulfoxide reductase heme-binding subunit YedZ